MYRKILVAFAFALPLMLLPVLSTAAQTEMTGTINGFACAQKEAPCPVDRMDPHLATESHFVLMAEGKNYLLTNVPRDVLARHVLEKVKVSGEVSEKYQSIKVGKIMVMKGDKWMDTWSKAAEQEEMKREMLP